MVINLRRAHNAYQIRSSMMLTFSGFNEVRLYSQTLPEVLKSLSNGKLVAHTHNNTSHADVQTVKETLRSLSPLQRVIFLYLWNLKILLNILFHNVLWSQTLEEASGSFRHFPATQLELLCRWWMCLTLYPVCDLQ